MSILDVMIYKEYQIFKPSQASHNVKRYYHPAGLNRKMQNLGI